MNFKKIGFVIVVVLLLGAAGWFVYGTGDGVDCPEFPQSSEPAVIVQVEPDFGYRIGDLVPITVFIKEPPGTKVDVASMALEGDFEIRGEPTLTKHQLADQSSVYCLKLTLQSFNAKRKLGASMSMVWEVANDPELKEIRQTLVEVYTSYTWDGRPKIQDGPLPFRTNAYHWYVSAAILLLSFGGLVWSILYSWWVDKAKAAYARQVYNSPAMVCKRKVDAALAKIETGDASESNFREIDVALRDYLGVSTVLLKHLPIVLVTAYRNHIMRVIIGCEKVIYRKQTLTDQELRQMRQDLDDVLLQRFVFSTPDPGYYMPEGEVDTTREMLEDLLPPNDFPR